MEKESAKVFVSALNRTSRRFKYYGEGSIANISLLKLIYKYACHSPSYATLQRLDSMVAELQRTDEDIPMQVTGLSAYVDSFLSPFATAEPISNNRPTITGSLITVTPETFEFSDANFISGFADADGDKANLITIKTLPANGTLTYNGVAIVAPFTLLSADGLVYTRNSDVAYSTSFTFTVTDSNCQIPMESLPATISLTVADLDVVVENDPAVIGDRAQYAGNRVSTVFSVADFTTQTIAPYFDPENNDLDAIRIDEVSTANTGIFYYLGSPVTVGQVITNAELASGAFYHVGPDINSISTDSFNASVRDTGSMIWVQ